MNKKVRVFVLILLTAGMAALSFFTGEFIGLKSGYAHSSRVKAPMDAAYMVSVLGLLENGMYEEAADMLETKLDNYIIEHWSAGRCALVGLNPFIKDVDRKEMFLPVITYRKAHPPRIGDGQERKIIQGHLDAMENGT